MRQPLPSSLFRGPAAFAALLLLLAGPATASAETECETDADCAAGEFCAATPCAGAPCEDGDEDCDFDFSCPSFCVESVEPEAECATDADCPDGFTCEQDTWESCSTEDCPEGEACSSEPVCESGSSAYCVYTPAPCSTDADCSDGFVCLTAEETSCSGGGAVPPCEPGRECPEPVPFDDEECETETVQFCGPRWLGPCEADADCGEGFTCAQAEMCTCSGGSEPMPPGMPGEDTPDGDDDSDPRPMPEEDCECEPSGDFYCEPQEIPCEADSDCPTDWTCYSWGDTATPCYYDAETGESVCEEPAPAEQLCVPPGFAEFIEDGGYNGPGIDRGESEVDVPTTPTDGEEPDEDGLGAGGDGGINGQTDGGRPSNSDDGGCSASASTSAPAGFFALLALVGLRRRRK